MSLELWNLNFGIHSTDIPYAFVTIQPIIKQPHLTLDLSPFSSGP